MSKRHSQYHDALCHVKSPAQSENTQNIVVKILSGYLLNAGLSCLMLSSSVGKRVGTKCFFSSSFNTDNQKFSSGASL